MRRGVIIGAVVVIVVAAAVTGIVLSTDSTSGRHGTVDVLYAGSLSDLMTTSIDPAFHAATGYTVTGVSNGSTALAADIKGGVEVGDVFLSASPTADKELEGAANGNWVSTYSVFGTSPLVLGYSPTSRFAHDLQTQPWYDVVSRAGFRLGRTDPATDPKGVLAVTALEQTATRRGLPVLDTLAHASSDVYEETALVGEVQSGQIDAGFFYAVEAAAAHLASVPLTGTTLAATYTVATLRGAPHRAGAAAFVSFLESAAGRRLLRANGITPPMS